MTALETLLSEAKERRDAIDKKFQSNYQFQIAQEKKCLLEATPWVLQEFAAETTVYVDGVSTRFDLPTFSIMAKTSKMHGGITVEWHWTRRSAWHHVYTLDEALVYGAEQGAVWVNLPDPF